MGADFMPETDERAMVWMSGFAHRIGLDPAVYHISIPDSDAISAAVQAYREAYFRANVAATRGPSATLAKNIARRKAERICRQFYRIIKHDPGIPADKKIDANVTPPPLSRRRIIAVPDTAPTLFANYTLVFGRHRVTFLNPENGRLAKPHGAAAIQLFMSMGETTNYDHATATMLGTYTKNPIIIPFKRSDDRKYANYVARWISRRGETGPWSRTRSLRIAA